MAKITAHGAKEMKRFRTGSVDDFTEVLFRSDGAILRRYSFRSGGRMTDGGWTRWTQAEALGQEEAERRLLADPNRKWLQR